MQEDEDSFERDERCGAIEIIASEDAASAEE